MFNDDDYWKKRKYNDALGILFLVMLGVSLGIMVSMYFC